MLFLVALRAPATAWTEFDRRGRSEECRCFLRPRRPRCDRRVLRPARPLERGRAAAHAKMSSSSGAVRLRLPSSRDLARHQRYGSAGHQPVLNVSMRALLPRSRSSWRAKASGRSRRPRVIASESISPRTHCHWDPERLISAPFMAGRLVLVVNDGHFTRDIARHGDREHRPRDGHGAAGSMNGWFGAIAVVGIVLAYGRTTFLALVVVFLFLAWMSQYAKDGSGKWRCGSSWSARGGDRRASPDDRDPSSIG